MELLDSHCHIQSIGTSEGEESTGSLWSKAKDSDPVAVIRRAEAAGVTRMVCVGCHLQDSQLAVDFAENHPECWASVGVHPHEAHRIDAISGLQELALLAKKPKVVAVGECGLDYFYEHSSKNDQARVLKWQMQIAIEQNLPLIFHVREAFDDFWPIFESFQSASRPIRGVLHSFTDSRENLERALEHKLYIGVNGIATFTKNSGQREMYQSIPLDHLLLETDAPFLTPYPYRGTICEPYHIRTIAEFLARLRSEPIAAIAASTTRNARTLFGI